MTPYLSQVSAVRSTDDAESFNDLVRPNHPFVEAPDISGVTTRTDDGRVMSDRNPHGYPPESGEIHRIPRFAAKVGDKRVSVGVNASDHQGCHTQLKIGGAPMTVEARGRRLPAFHPPNQASRVTNPWKPWTTPGADRQSSPADERTQREHELNRALEAARTLQERLELADLPAHVPAVREIRNDLVDRLAHLVAEDFYRAQARDNVVIVDDLQPTLEAVPID